jgi:hypothetical protein
MDRAMRLSASGQAVSNCLSMSRWASRGSDSHVKQLSARLNADPFLARSCASHSRPLRQIWMLKGNQAWMRAFMKPNFGWR